MSSSDSARHVVTASLPATAAMASPANGSAHHQSNRALAPRPRTRTPDRRAHRLGGVGLHRPRPERRRQPLLGPGQPRHHEQRQDRHRQPGHARLGAARRDQLTYRLHSDVGGQQTEADGDRPGRPAVALLHARASALPPQVQGEDHDGGHLDGRVEAEPTRLTDPAATPAVTATTPSAAFQPMVATFSRRARRTASARLPATAAACPPAPGGTGSCACPDRSGVPAAPGEPAGAGVVLTPRSYRWRGALRPPPPRPAGAGPPRLTGWEPWR